MFKHLMSVLVVFGCLLGSQKACGQGGDLLIQQYGKADIENIGLRRWNYDAHLLFNRFNTSDRETKGKLGMSVGASVQYNFKKSYGLRSGVTLHRINYAYDLAADTSKDQLVFLSVPLSGRLYPVKKVVIELGIVYNFLLNAKGDPPANLEDESVSYSLGTFNDSFGMLSSVHYKVRSRFSASLQYQFQKKNTNPLQRETSAFSGLLLGIHYTLLSDKISPN